MDFKNIGKALRWLRDERGKKQREVAKSAGITPAMLSAYETGKHRPSLDTTERVLTALECDVVELVHALHLVGHQNKSDEEGRPVPEDGLKNVGTDLTAVAEGAIGTGELQEEEKALLASLLPGLLHLIRYLKKEG